MGWFFRKKKDKQVKPSVEPVGLSAKIYSVDPLEGDDMLAVIKREQSREQMLNPFAEENAVDLNLSVAKRYGQKYMNAAAKGQLASTKVVDVRSYVKTADESSGLVQNKKTELEEMFDELDREEDERKKENVEVKPKLSFFDELMRDIDKDIRELEQEEDETQSEPEEEIKVEPVKKLPKKPVAAKKTTKRKKSVDIDIISGDFGGTDIL